MTFIFPFLTSPSVSRNQQNAVALVNKALTGLVGFNWGQLGDAAFFLVGAMRTENQQIQTFKLVFYLSLLAFLSYFFSISIQYNNGKSFAKVLGNQYEANIRRPFMTWAKDALPGGSQYRTPFFVMS